MIRYGLILVLLLSCSKENGGKWYWIPKGEHYSTPIGNKLFVENRSGEEWEWEVLFDSSCLYTSADLLDSSNIGDVNKLVGFSDCGLNHSQNSFRIGWRPSLYSDSLELLSYVRRDGTFTFTPITTIRTNELIFIYLTFSDTTYICCINGICDTTERVCSDWVGRKRALFPYFGGDETSPHDMRMWIKDLEL